MVRPRKLEVKGGFREARTTGHAAQARSARRRSASARMPQNPGMAPPLPDDPVLPGATWRRLLRQDGAPAATNTLVLALPDGFTVSRRFVRLRRPVTV
jgi:hypothetical protein